MMTTSQDARERDSPRFEALLDEFLDRIERAALEKARKFGGIALQILRHAIITLAGLSRVVALLFVMFAFPYFAWGSLGEAILFSPTPQTFLIGLILVFALPVALGVAAFKSWKNGGSLLPNSATENPNLATTADQINASVDPESLLQSAIRVGKALFAAVDPRQLQSGLLFYLLVVIGGAVVLFALTLWAPFAQPMRDTLLAQPNLFVVEMLVRGAEHIWAAIAFTLSLVLPG